MSNTKTFNGLKTGIRVRLVAPAHVPLIVSFMCSSFTRTKQISVTKFFNYLLDLDFNNPTFLC